MLWKRSPLQCALTHLQQDLMLHQYLLDHLHHQIYFLQGTVRLLLLPPPQHNLDRLPLKEKDMKIKEKLKIKLNFNIVFDEDLLRIVLFYKT